MQFRYEWCWVECYLWSAVTKYASNDASTVALTAYVVRSLRTRDEVRQYYLRLPLMETACSILFIALKSCFVTRRFTVICYFTIQVSSLSSTRHAFNHRFTVIFSTLSICVHFILNYIPNYCNRWSSSMLLYLTSIKSFKNAPCFSRVGFQRYFLCQQVYVLLILKYLPDYCNRWSRRRCSNGSYQCYDSVCIALKSRFIRHTYTVVCCYTFHVKFLYTCHASGLH